MACGLGISVQTLIWGPMMQGSSCSAATEAALVLALTIGLGNGVVALKTLQRLSVALRVKPQPLPHDFKTLQDCNGPSHTVSSSQTDFLLILQTSLLPSPPSFLSSLLPYTYYTVPFIWTFSCSALHFSG